MTEEQQQQLQVLIAAFATAAGLPPAVVQELAGVGGSTADWMLRTAEAGVALSGGVKKTAAQVWVACYLRGIITAEQCIDAKHAQIVNSPWLNLALEGYDQRERVAVLDELERNGGPQGWRATTLHEITGQGS